MQRQSKAEDKNTELNQSLITSLASSTSFDCIG